MSMSQTIPLRPWAPHPTPVPGRTTVHGWTAGCRVPYGLYAVTRLYGAMGGGTGTRTGTRNKDPGPGPGTRTRNKDQDQDQGPGTGTRTREVKRPVLAAWGGKRPRFSQRG